MMPKGVYKRKSLVQRFYEKIKVNSETGCWEWTAYKSVDGYGRMPVNRKSKEAHRVSWQLHFGEIPDGQSVCHKCDNPKCVNPSHLFLGSHADNMIDKINKRRQSRGQSCAQSKLNNKLVETIRFCYKKGFTQTEIASYLNMSQGTISRVVRGEAWTHVK